MMVIPSATSNSAPGCRSSWVKPEALIEWTFY
jgi:hypothetical protein